MAIITTNDDEGFDYRWEIGDLGSLDVISSTPTIVVYQHPESVTATFTLTGNFSAFDFDGRPTAGTLDSLIISDGAIVTTIQVNMDVATYNAYVAANDGPGLFAFVTSGPDIFNGGPGDDDMRTNAGADTLSGGDGNDRLNGGLGDDTLSGDAGADILYGGDGGDTLNGGDDRDGVLGGRGTDTLNGGGGDDFLAGGQTIAALLDAPAALNTFNWNFAYYNSEAAPDVYDGGAGNDYALLNYLLQTNGFTVDISNSAAVNTVLRDGLAFGTLTSIEALYFQGGLGADHVVGGSSIDSLLGGAGNDTFEGGAGNDILSGEFGNDTLTGGVGSDILSGGAGIDTAVYAGLRSDYSFTVNQTSGAFTITGGTDGGDSVTGIEYLQFSDQLVAVLTGTQVGGAGTDVLNGVSTTNVDLIDGQDGDDTINGGNGPGWLYGGDDDDTITGGTSVDTIDGGDGNDTIDGGAGSFDTIVGGAGNDTITGFGSVHGEAGDDSITGDGSLLGGPGADTLTDSVNVTTATLEGGVGDDIIIGAGATTTVSYNSAGDSVHVDLQITTSQDTGSATGFDTITNTLNLLGGGYDDLLTGNALANTINGGAGDDTLYGLDGDDTLIGLFGDDTVNGGLGSDTASWTGVSFDVEVDLRLTGRQFTGYGGGYDELISIENLTGSGQNDILNGDDNNNVLQGLAGNDLLDGHGGTDTASYQSNTTLVTVSLLLAGQAQNTGGATGFDTLISIENLTGSSFNDTLTGDGGVNQLAGLSGNDTLDGGAGADTLIGGTGDDTYVVDSLSDVVTELASEGTDTVQTNQGARFDYNALYLLPTNVENLTGTSSGAQGVWANSGDNVVTMGGGNDLLVMADGGVDTVNGGGGNDYIYFGGTLTAADQIDGGVGYDTLGLIGSTTVTLTTSMLNLERMAVYSAAFFGGGAFDYAITTVDANISSAGLFVTAASLQATEHLTFDASAETSGGITVHGGAGDDVISTGAGSDFIIGNGGADILTGNGGADVLLGGAGNDTFVYRATSDSIQATMDNISGFASGDRIDLSTIDAITGGANDAFSFIGAAAFSNTAGQVRAVNTSGSTWQVQADVNGDGVADLVILVGVGDGQPLDVSDFVL